jgi:hypothetical protein
MYRTDIRKPATQKAQIQRPMTSQSATNSGTPSEVRSADLAQYTEPVSDDEEDEGNRHIATTSHEAAWADVDPQAAAEARAFREAQSKMQKGPGGQPDQSHLTAAVPSAPKELFMKLTPANLSKLVQSRYELERDTGLNESQDSRANNGNASGLGHFAGPWSSRVRLVVPRAGGQEDCGAGAGRTESVLRERTDEWVARSYPILRTDA